jgi:tRNA threonylcarbamoyladenosine biosynthesis protein TsaE
MSSEQTEQLAEALGKQLSGGEVIELISDLGGGKTTFTRGLVRGLGSADIVASPTFTISKVYGAGKLEVHHFDFYRLSEPGIIADELAEVVGDPASVVVVEWADVVQHVLPDKRLTVVIEQTATGSRRLTFRAPESLMHLIEALQNA